MTAKQKKTGRPRVEFGPEMIDRAKELLGRYVFASRAADALVQEFKFGRDSAHRLIAEARDDTVRCMKAAGTADDPLVALYLFFKSVFADARVDMKVRVAAATSAARVLGNARHPEDLGSDDVEEFLAAVLARRAARTQTRPNNPAA